MDPVRQLTREQLEEIVRRVREALWLTHDCWTRNREWGADTCPEVADALTAHGLRPAEGETRACGNCDEDFVPRPGDEAHAEGFCCGHCLSQHRGGVCQPGCPYCPDGDGGDDTPAAGDPSSCAETDPPSAEDEERLYEAAAYVVVSKGHADGGQFPDDEALRRALAENFGLHLDTEEESNPCGIAALRLDWDTLRRVGAGDGAAPAPIREALRNVLQYCWADEEDDARDHLRENGTLAGHVFADLGRRSASVMARRLPRAAPPRRGHRLGRLLVGEPRARAEHVVQAQVRGQLGPGRGCLALGQAAQGLGIVPRVRG